MEDEQTSLLKIYTTILDNCRNRKAQEFLIKRIYKILTKNSKKRKETEFPKTPFDVQVVHLVAYLKENKIPYAVLYASSLVNLIEKDTSINEQNATKKPRTIYQRMKVYLWWFMGLYAQYKDTVDIALLMAFVLSVIYIF